MANIDRPNGFRPVQGMDGSPWNGALRKFPAGARLADAANNHGDIYIGDVVQLDATGGAIPADTTNVIAGVVAGVGTRDTTFGDNGPFNPDNLEKRHLRFDEAGDVWIVPADSALFEVQTATGVAAAPVIGSLANMTAAAGVAHGSRPTSQSNVELAAGVGVDVRVMGHSTTPDNDLTSENARVIVKFQNTL